MAHLRRLAQPDAAAEQPVERVLIGAVPLAGFGEQAPGGLEILVRDHQPARNGGDRPFGEAHMGIQHHGLDILAGEQCRKP